MYQRKIEIPYYGCHTNGQARIDHLVREIIETSTLDSERAEEGLQIDGSWVIYSWDIEFYRLPRARESVFIETNVTGWRKYFAYRRFDITDESGNLLVRAKSVWVMVDPVNHAVIRLPQKIIDAYGVDVEAECEMPKIKALQGEMIRTDVQVRHRDIDINRHVNNAVYVEWLLEFIREREEMDVKRLVILYKKETVRGQTVQINHRCDDSLCMGHIYHKESQETSASFQMEWKPLKNE